MAVYHRDQEDWDEAARCATFALICHHAKRPDLRPDFYKALVALCRSKVPPTRQAAFNQRLSGYGDEWKKLMATADRLKQTDRLTITPAFEKWLADHNRTLQKRSPDETTAFVALTNAELQPNRRSSSMTRSSRSTGTSRSIGSSQASTVTASPGAADLIAQIDTNQHAIRGRWNVSNGALVSPRTSTARIELPVDPPQEYDLNFVITRSLGTGELTVGLVRDGVQSMLYFDRGTSAGIDGLNPPLLSASLLQRGRTVPLTIQVRREGVTVMSGSRTVMSKRSRTDFPETPAEWKVRNGLRLFLGSNGAMFTVRDLSLQLAD